eukprot:TRINITY_DN3460_c0_g1_i1.p1 TRINITY_DN3460_c0_g1~~TRINITY_DN3460_c0_g1_i1.p1  ORF type:complete len:854 (+),score=189.03 TRINITY_DN3460_c0_g1_i1:554-3115(+)
MVLNMKGISLVVLSLFVSLTLAADTFYPGYKLTSLNQTKTGLTGTLSLISPGPFGSDINTLALNVYYYTDSIVRVKITDPSTERWEVPNVIQLPLPTEAPDNLNYKINFSDAPFGFSLTRVDNLETVFNTTPSGNTTQFNGTIFEDQYIEFSTSLPSVPNIYGLGERVHAFRLDSTGSTYTIFNVDQGTPVDKNLYGSHPFYLDMRTNGLANGVFLLNSNAMDVYVGPGKITYKVVGGVIDLWFMLGPTPNQVVKQYHQIIGTPHMPAYWHLGYHQCRWGYYNLSLTMDVVNNFTYYNIPLETMWNDIDYMDSFEDFTLDPVNFPTEQMRSFIQSLHDNGQHYIMITDPGILAQKGYPPFVDGMEQDIFIKSADGKTPIVGEVWPGYTVFPDFLNPNTEDYWYDQISNFHKTGPQFDGLWIDMNEVSNFCTGQCGNIPTPSSASKLKYAPGFNPEKPPYLPGGQKLDWHTLNMTAIQNGSLIMYNTHNLFGWSEGIATKNVLESLFGTRSIVISRSTFAGSGNHNGHWLGDNNSDFDDLYYSMPGILDMNMFGIALVGADICGFNGNTTEELCTRWMQLGSFYPFMRNHNAIYQRSQEPYAFGPQLIQVSRDVIENRYSLLPYYYTLFYEANTYGGTLWRSLFFEFPTDTATFLLDRQVMVGPALLVSPVLQQNATTVSAYFPAAAWYDYTTGLTVGSTTTGSWITLPAPLEVINSHIRGGYIIPTQTPAMTTTLARKNPYSLVVALDQNGNSAGTLFIDDGESLDTVANGKYTLIAYQVIKNSLTNNIRKNGYSGVSSLYLNTVSVYGVQQAVTVVTLNNQKVPFTYSSKVLRLDVNGLNLGIDELFDLAWK